MHGTGRPAPGRTRWLSLLALAGVVLAAVGGGSPAQAGYDRADQAPTARFQPAPCPVAFPGTLTVDCGVLTVPENHMKPNGRTVQLPVAILRTDATHPKPDPLVYVTGGPSFNELDIFSAQFMHHLPASEGRDVILYNQRGVGYAKPNLGCPELDTVRARINPFATFDQWLDAVRACHDRLTGHGIDLASYDSEEDAADLNDLRLALGYDRWNLYVLSAGGEMGLTEMRLFPEGLRSVILDSAVSPLFEFRGPDSWRGLNRVLEMVFAGCAANQACASAYPKLRARFYRRVEALRQDPITVEIPVEGGGTAPLVVEGELLLDVAASCGGDPFCAPGLPGALDAAAHGDLGVFFDDWVFAPEPPINGVVAEGKTMSYRCRGSIDFEPDSELQAAARELPEWRDHLLTLDYVYPPGTREACKEWKVGRADAAQHDPAVSSIPTLVLTGKWDSVIWPVEAARIASTLDHSYLYEFPGIAHFTLAWATFGPNDCPSVIAAEFIASPNAEPDSACIATMADVDFTPSSGPSRSLWLRRTEPWYRVPRSRLWGAPED